MAKKDKGPGCLMYLFFFVVLGVLAVYLLFSNAFNFKTLLCYGPSQYFVNIIHFQSDAYCRAESTLSLYENILPADVIEKKQKRVPIALLEPGKRFKLKGYRTKEYVTWIAAKVTKGPDVIYGYFMVPDKISIPTFMATLNRLHETVLGADYEPFSNKYFAEIPSKTTDQYRNTLLRDLKTKLGQTVKLKSTNDPTEMQKIKESKDFKIIDEISSGATVYYCPKDEFEKAETLYDAFLGSGFDTNYLQINDTYDYGREGLSRESAFVRGVDSWYFKVLVALLLLWLLKRIRKGSRRNSASEDPVMDEVILKQKIQSQAKTISIDLSPGMSVRTLKEQFRNAFGSEIRVYTTIHTKRLADDDVPLSSLRDVKGFLVAVTIEPSATVSQIEKLFKDMGIGIQVMKKDGSGLAPNNAGISDI